MSKTYADVAATALREFAESNGVYVSTATAGAGIGAILDALGEHGADMGVVHQFLNDEVDEWPEGASVPPQSENADLLKQAAEILLKVAESL